MLPFFAVQALAAAVAVAPPPAPPSESAIYDGRPAAAPGCPVDTLVFGRLAELGIRPAWLCSDAVFVRRAYLDVIGTVPTAEEARAFIQDRSPGKRAALVERLLARDEFAEYWAMRWSDVLKVKAEFPVNLWPNAAQAYHRWIREQIRSNAPYDRFARDLLTSSGSNFRVAPVNFYRAVQNREPATLARAVALTFLGARAEKWPAERLAGMAAFFSQVGYKPTQEWKEEIVYWDPQKPLAAGARFPDGTPAAIYADRDPREVFADWLARPDNPWLSRAIANRVWAWLMGRGIVQEPDDFRADNPPANPALLDYLGRELVASHYDLKHLYRLILESQVYQLSCVSRSENPAAAANFASYPVRRLDAEVLIDALDAVTGTTEEYSSPIPEPFTYVPEEERSIDLPDGSISSAFLEMFGRSPRATGIEEERNNHPSATQALYLLNSTHVRQKLQQSPKLRAVLRTAGAKGQGDPLDALYLTILSRHPTSAERAAIAGYRGSGSAPPGQAPLDVAWALINSAEFLCRH